MLYYPNYTTTDWDGNPITANFIAGEVSTYEYYSYGVFECNATFANQPGSFPAFWLISAEDCNAIHNNEIDIVELKYDHANPTLDNNTFQYGIPCGADADGHEFTPNPFTWGGTHTFKCIWSPSKIEFWVDNTFLHQIFNAGQDWYPQYNQRVILSQQIIDYNNNSPGYGISTPQTSNFHWVRVKKFFLAPEITCPTIICSSGTASMDVDSQATNITWQLTPSYLFTVSSGNGSTANIVRASGANGLGKITYTFYMPSGESFTADKEFWVGEPLYTDITFDVYRSDGVHATKMGNIWILCPNTTYHIYVMNSGLCSTSNYAWTVPSSWTRYYTYNNIISINTNSAPGGQIIVNATTCCSSNRLIITGYMGSNYNCGRYFMVLSPNPATSETTMELAADGDKTVDENTQWELEVYDQQQSLKEKKTKLKGKQTKLNTSNWKDGVYIVRVRIGDELISEKLVVKHW